MSEEAAPINNGAPSQVPFQFRLVHLLYATSVLAAGLATFGGVGVVWSVVIVTFWAAIFASVNRVKSFTLASMFLLVFGLFVVCLVPANSTARHAARGARCTINIKQIVLALHAYHGAYGTFPPAYIADKRGNPLHSWRVLILPFLNEQALYDQYNFKESWNGPNNRKLLSSLPSVYGCPMHVDRAANPAGVTNYVAVVGDESAWPGATARCLDEFRGNAANTILLLEVSGHAIPWLAPQDLSVDEAVAMLTEIDPDKAGIHRFEGFFYEHFSASRRAAQADGSVAFIGVVRSPDKLRSLLTIGGDVKFEDLEFQWSQRTHRPRLGNWFRLAVFVVVTLFPLPWVWRKRTASAPSDFAAQPIRQPL